MYQCQYPLKLKKSVDLTDREDIKLNARKEDYPNRTCICGFCDLNAEKGPYLPNKGLIFLPVFQLNPLPQGLCGVSAQCYPYLSPHSCSTSRPLLIVLKGWLCSAKQPAGSYFSIRLYGMKLG
jgi:hypothetical protein